MLKALVKKQFQEMFRGFFVNQKTGQAIRKGRMVGRILLFAFLLGAFSSMFFAMGMLLCGGLSQNGYQWLYFALMALMTLLMGVFGSIFTTYSSLYLSKDNEFLLSLPIPPTKLLASRLISVYLLSMLYGDCAWLPTILCHLFLGTPTALSILFSLVLLFFLPLLISTITCLLGYVVALMTSKIRNKSIFVVLLSCFFLGVYYTFTFHLSDIMTYLVDNSTEVAGLVKIWGSLFYLIGQAADGNALSFLVFCLIALLSFLLCFFLMAKSFYHILTRGTKEKKVVYQEKRTTARSLGHALLHKELKRFLSSPVYMMNCGLGILFMASFPFILFFKREEVEIVLENLGSYGTWAPLAFVLSYAMISGMDMVTTPSISLEGKTLWVLRALPVSGKDVLKAKENLHFLLNAIPLLLSLLPVGIMMGFSWPIILLMALVLVLYVDITALLGLITGLLKPNFQWVSETTVIKQSLNVLVTMVIDFLLSVISVGLFYFLYDTISVAGYLGGLLAFYALLLCLLKRWVYTKGGALFEKL